MLSAWFQEGPLSDPIKPHASAAAKLIHCDYFRHHLGGHALGVQLVVHLGGAGRGGKRMTNLKLNQTRRTKIKRLNSQPFTMACWEPSPFASDLQVTYGGLFTFCYWFMFFQKGEIPPVDFDCFPVCLSPPTPPPSSIWFRLICPEVSGTKEVVGFFFFFLWLNKKSTIFPGRFRLIHVMWLWIHTSRLLSVFRLLRQPRLHVSHEWTAPAAWAACNSQRHPTSTRAFGHVHIVDSQSRSKTSGLVVLPQNLRRLD